MSRLDRLRQMRVWIDAEIAAELAAEARTVRADPIVTRVCDLYGVRVEEVMLGVRRHDVTRVRHAIAWMLHREGVSIGRLARMLGYSGRRSVCAALLRVENDQAMRALLLGIEAA